MKRAIYRLLLPTCFVLLPSCHATPPHYGEHQNEAESIAKASVQPIYIDFKSGHPVVDEALIDAMIDSSSTLTEVVATVTDTMQKSPNIVIEVIGFTDDHECAGRACYDLSLRRAMRVYDWLVAHGVSATRLRGPSAAGSAWPLEDSDTEIGRSYNRRVQLNLLLMPTTQAQPLR
jgi:flagellar motor protein MotB